MATQQLTIPMFPLNMVLLPGETKTLHIFEERYKQLVADCLDNEAHFGIPFMHQKAMGDYGIEVKISNVIKLYENGELDIAIEAIRVFKIIEFSKVLTPKLYYKPGNVKRDFLDGLNSKLLKWFRSKKIFVLFKQKNQRLSCF